MKIIEYLQTKYQVQKPTTLTTAEAESFQIPLPLQHGWLAFHGGRQALFTKTCIRRMKKRLQRQQKSGAEEIIFTARGLRLMLDPNEFNRPF